jgi:hypothetical protein
MLDDADDGRPARDAPQLDPLYRNYVKACQRLGVDPLGGEPPKGKSARRERRDGTEQVLRHIGYEPGGAVGSPDCFACSNGCNPGEAVGRR